MLTYIIHFQNSGSDTAYNIFIVDTIDANLNIGTINILTSSHYMEFYRDENIYTFSFPYIMLPDSTTNLTASQGFVSYSIKPKANLPGGTMITNTANIFFDYNPAVVTNTTINTIAHATDISPDKGNVSNGIIVYPNPAKTELFIQFREFPVNTNIVLSDLTGRQIYTHSINTSLMRISLADISQGLYFLQVQGTDKIVTFKIAVK
ncbi:MAG: T9SS type A sorting domain-containing protein [Bacteroidia bacterium]|nr:T9SS type A sorting domain-containing protein [Bacteroidia bacterium]